MQKLHPSTALVEARLQAQGHTWAWLGRKIDATAQTMNNWRGRGIPPSRALAIASVLSLRPEDILQADPEHTKHHQSYGHQLEAKEPQAHYMSPFSRLDAPIFKWEHLVSTGLPQRFSVEVPDHALAPELHAGDLVTIDCAVAPAAGDLVLCRDFAGTMFLREYRVKRPGVWVAASLNNSFEPLHSDKEGLSCVGVVVEQTRRRRRSSTSP